MVVPRTRQSETSAPIIIKVSIALTILIFTYLCIFIRKINIAMATIYASPEMEIYEILTEGVLCASNETVKENEGEW